MGKKKKKKKKEIKPKQGCVPNCGGGSAEK